MHPNGRQQIVGFVALWAILAMPVLIVLGLVAFFFRVVWLTLKTALIAALFLYATARYVLHVDQTRARPRVG